jgi:hypothetical protein
MNSKRAEINKYIKILEARDSVDSRQFLNNIVKELEMFAYIPDESKIKNKIRFIFKMKFNKIENTVNKKYYDNADYNLLTKKDKKIYNSYIKKVRNKLQYQIFNLEHKNNYYQFIINDETNDIKMIISNKIKIVDNIYYYYVDITKVRDSTDNNKYNYKLIKDYIELKKQLKTTDNKEKIISLMKYNIRNRIIFYYKTYYKTNNNVKYIKFNKDIAIEKDKIKLLNKYHKELLGKPIEKFTFNEIKKLREEYLLGGDTWLEGDLVEIDRKIIKKYYKDTNYLMSIYPELEEIQVR